MTRTQTSSASTSAPVAAELGGRWLSRCFGNLEDPKTRRRIYAWVAVVLYFIALGLMTLKSRYGHNDRLFDFASSDGKYYYVYVASTFVRGTLDSHIMWEHWGYSDNDKKNPLDPNGRVHNQYPIGVALSIVPSFALAHIASFVVHGITRSAYFAPDGYSILYQLFNLGWLFYLAWATFVMLDSLMMRYFRLTGTAITLAILGTWIGTQFVYHQMRFPMMSVVTGPFWATALVYLGAAAIDRIENAREVGWQWPGMIFCLAMAVVCRNTNAMLGAFCVYPFYVLVRAGLFGNLVRQTPWIVLACLPVFLQMCVWKYQYGHFFANSYGTGAVFYWTHPAFWQIMFSVRAGLFLWVPVWTLGTIGAILYFRGYRGSWILGTYLACFVIIWYVNSAYWAWPFSNYPNRGFLELIGLPALGLALLIQQSQNSLTQRRLVLGALAASTLFILVLSAAYDARKVPRYGDTVNDMGPKGAWQAR